jgi:hypothetical protein
MASRTGIHDDQPGHAGCAGGGEQGADKGYLLTGPAHRQHQNKGAKDDDGDEAQNDALGRCAMQTTIRRIASFSDHELLLPSNEYNGVERMWHSCRTRWAA